MLGPVELTMNPPPRFPPFISGLLLTSALRPGFRRITAIALLVCSCSIATLHAQNSAPANKQSAPTDLPAAPAASATTPVVATPAFERYQFRTQFPTPSLEKGASFNLGSLSLISPFQPAANFGNLAGSPGSALDFNNANRFGTARQPTIGFNQINSFNIGGRQSNLPTLYPTSSVTGSPFGATPLLSLNQLMHGAANLQLNSSSAFRFQYSSMLTPSDNLNGFARPYNSVLFTSSDLGNGVFLSAGTYNGSHSMAGAAAASPGNGTGAPKHSGSGVAIKLSF